MVGFWLELELESEEWGLMEAILFEVMVRSEGWEVPGRVTLVRLSVVMVSSEGVDSGDCVWFGGIRTRMYTTYVV